MQRGDIMREWIETKEDKLNFIIEKLNYLIGLEFVQTDEIKSCKLAIRILKREIKKIEKGN